MVLRLYNTLTRDKAEFRPLDPSHVRMYVCGPTVYDFAHIGNARPVIVFDVLYRLLKQLYEPAARVTYVRNVTDVDDKINARAVQDFPEMKPVDAIRHLTEKTYAQFSADVAALGCLPPTVEPRATEHIAEMIAIMERLVASGHAYAAEGHVLFHVPSMADYGALARRSLDDMIAGARVDIAPYKRDPMDFVLWKPSTDDEPGWASPWGRGRPGWHLECSAMSWKHLGETFDIHGGGIDLVFPHHENEIAQSRCAFHTPVMAQVWMHNGFLQVEGEKMSKSLGNFFTIRELLDDWPGEVLRLTMLKTHYRQPIDWTLKSVEESARTLDDWYWLARDLPAAEPDPAVIEALSDDLNTPKAIAELHGLRNAAQRSGSEGDLARFVGSLRFLGFLGETAEAWASRKKAAAGVDQAAVEALVQARLAARKARNFAESDRLRDELAAMGVVLKDSKDPKTGEIRTEWEVGR
ncbi:cysteine--tRNA ligase [Prosthecomicrobium sp. N25]|uniref:cysteine--tRNA ligase n=1 Tax=Prosthecomicrobium sp. N25 TaxID=3129254 RepID=UPI003076F032